MMPSRTKSGRSANSNTNSQGVLKASRCNRNGSAPPPEKHSLPPSKPRVSVDRPTKSVESKVSNKNSTSPTVCTKSELQEKSEAVEMELKKTREELRVLERERIEAVEELSEAKRSADEMNEELQKATVARARAEEILDTEKLRAVELEETLHKELENLRIRHEQDVSSLNSMADELQKAEGELRDARADKELACREAEGAKTAAKLHEEKVEKLEAETVLLKLELERARIAEEKLIHMELLVEKLQIEATDARNGESDVCALADEWRNKAERLKADLEEAYQSEKSASDSLADMMVKLEETESLFEDAKREISILEARIDSSEIESERQKIDLEESNMHLDLARQDALNIGKTVELLKLELERLEEEKSAAVNGEKVAAEENRKLTDELELSKDEGEKTSKAMECLASKVKSMSIEAGEKEERLARMQSEIEESHKERDHLSRVLRNTEERYEVMLDEARYELVCLQNRCKGNEWDAKEKNFIDAIRGLEEEVASLKAKTATMTVESHEMAEHEKNQSAEMISENSSLDEEEEEEQSKNENLQANETTMAEDREVLSSIAEMECSEENGRGSEIPFKEQEDDQFQEDQKQKKEEEDPESKTNCDGGDRMNGTEQLELQRRRKKKKALIYNFGNLLKKGNH